MKRKVIKFFELLIFVAILLVLVQTFLEDFAICASWQVNIRRILIVTGFAFDLFFTIEFLVRLYWAMVGRKVKYYLFNERGWIDFLASIPLLMFNSGPALLSLLASGTIIISLSGIFNILKVLKAIRIARILRFLRIIKIFKNIKYAESPMAQRHIARIISLCVTTFVIILFLFITISSIITLPGMQTAFATAHNKTIEYISTGNQSDIQIKARINKITSLDASLLQIKKTDETVIFSRHKLEYWQNNYMAEDYTTIHNKDKSLIFVFDQKPKNQEQSIQNLIYFFMIVFIVLVFLFIYSPHFALTITDPIHVMKSGMEDKNYNLEVKILKYYREDDIFKLAHLYNEKYLPLKDRTIAQGESDFTEIKIEDIDFGLEQSPENQE